MLYRKLVLSLSLLVCGCVLAYNCKPITEDTLLRLAKISDDKEVKTDDKDTKSKQYYSNKAFVDFNNSNNNDNVAYNLTTNFLFFKSKVLGENIKHTLDGITAEDVLITDKQVPKEVSSLFSNIDVIGKSPVIIYHDAYMSVSTSSRDGKALMKGIENEKLNFKLIYDYVYNVSLADREVNVYVPNEESIYFEDVLLYLGSQIYTLETYNYCYSKDTLAKEGYIDKAREFIGKCLPLRDHEAPDKIQSTKSDLFITSERVMADCDYNVYNTIDGTQLDSTVQRELYILYNTTGESAELADTVLKSVHIQSRGYRHISGKPSNENLSYSDEPKHTTIVVNEISK